MTWKEGENFKLCKQSRNCARIFNSICVAGGVILVVFCVDAGCICCDMIAHKLNVAPHRCIQNAALTGDAGGGSSLPNVN